MHPTIEKLLKANKVVVTDGAWGTQLQQRGLKAGENPDAWTLSNPAAVESVAASYVEAGSRVILTNTFGANSFVLSKFGLQHRVAEINAAGVAISKKAANGKALVFASLGPSGQLLMNDGDLRKRIYAAFEEQAIAIENAGADAIVIETMTNLREAVVATEAAKKTNLPVITCMVFDSGKDKDRTMMGDTIEKIIQTLTSAGADVIGTNCGQGITGFIPICKKMRSLTNMPLWMKPNAGLPVFENGKAYYHANPEDFTNCALELMEAGANFIGGCCGTSPNFINALSGRLSNN
jgi:5-methyltetrahydrofolate--homocysteine methyltransferase